MEKENFVSISKSYIKIITDHIHEMVLYASAICISLSHGVREPEGKYMHSIHGKFFLYSYVVVIKD